MSKREYTRTEKVFSPALCVTHNCNLSCVYCYQNHDVCGKMNCATAQKCIDWILDNIPEDREKLVINFIGGEPLLEFELIKAVYEYVKTKKINIPIIFFASTNGTVLNQEMKLWFQEHKNDFILGLSLDGDKESQDMNRSNSYDKIDISYFVNTYPKQGVKMTISEFSLKYLADNIIKIYEKGFQRIDGVNLFEGEFDWSQEKYLWILADQLKKMVKYYVDNPYKELNQMLGKSIEVCAATKREKKKNCGIGNNTIFFDIDGRRYPCSYMTPMTFTANTLKSLSEVNFDDEEKFVDEECYNKCYIYPICTNCAAANFQRTGRFDKRDKGRCKINKMIALFTADTHAKRITNNPELYSDETKLYYTIEAIKKIRELYLLEFEKYLKY